MAQLDDLDFIVVKMQDKRRDTNLQFQCLAGSCNSPTNGFLAVDSIRRAARSDQQDFQLPVFRVLLASTFMGANYELKENLVDLQIPRCCGKTRTSNLAWRPSILQTLISPRM